MMAFSYAGKTQKMGEYRGARPDDRSLLSSLAGAQAKGSSRELRQL